jgi:hypothetical protein
MMMRADTRMRDAGRGPGTRDVRRKLRSWAGRYLPAELLGTLAALAAAWTAHAASDSMASAAIAGAVGEGLGFYGCVAVRELRYQRDVGTRTRRWRTGMATVQTMLIEFGPAELVDSLLTRPLLMYLLPGLLHDLTAGIVAGKLAADVVFYGIAIAAYELRQHYPALPGSAER